MQITSVLTFGHFYLIQLFATILIFPVSESQNLLQDIRSRSFESMFENEIFSIARRLLVSRFSAFQQEIANQLQGVKQEIVKNKLENDAAVLKLSQSVQDLSLRVSQIITERNSNREHIKSSINQYHNITITIQNEMSVLRDEVTATNSKMLDKIANLQIQMGEIAENVTINRNKTDEISFENRKLHVMIEETDSKLLNTEAQIANKFQDQQLNASIQLNVIRSDVSALRNATNSSENAVLENLEKLAISLKELVKNFSTTNKLENDVSFLQSEVKGLSRRMSNKIADMQVHIGEITENVSINRNKTDQISVENRKLNIKIQETNSKLLNSEVEIENKLQDHQFNASLQLNAIRSDVSVLRNATKTSEKNDQMVEKIDKIAISLNQLTQNFSSTVTIENDLSVLQSDVKALNIKMSDKIANVQMNIGEIIDNVIMNRNKTDQLSVESRKLHIKIQETDSKLQNTEVEIENKLQEHKLNASFYMNAIQSEMYALRKTTNYNEKVMLDFDNLTASLDELIQNFSLTNANVQLLLKVQIRQDRKINNITKQQVVFETAIQKLANESSYCSGTRNTAATQSILQNNATDQPTFYSTDGYQTTQMSTSMTTPESTTIVVLNEAFCTFEPQDDCFLENSTKDDFDWTSKSGSTSSSNTGPNGAKGGLYYSYIEVSDPRKTGDTASLVSKELIAGGQKCLVFDYHMRGDGMGKFKVFTLKEGTVDEIFSRSGEQGNDWNFAAIPLISVESYKLRFDGIKGSNFKGDIAIDNIRILQGNCARHKIRLVGGSSTREGRIEVYSHGEWGTVCDDSFETNDGMVVCKMLGFNRVVSVRDQAYFGQGTGSILMDDVACSGSESSIFECTYTSNHNCGHSEDAGVQCD